MSGRSRAWSSATEDRRTEQEGRPPGRLFCGNCGTGRAGGGPAAHTLCGATVEFEFATEAPAKRNPPVAAGGATLGAGNPHRNPERARQGGPGWPEVSPSAFRVDAKRFRLSRSSAISSTRVVRSSSSRAFARSRSKRSMLDFTQGAQKLGGVGHRRHPANRSRAYRPGCEGATDLKPRLKGV